MTKIMIVGDVHGEWGRLNQLISSKQPDIVLQTGEFGWWPTMSISKSVIYGQKSWRHEGVKIPEGSRLFWADGNHEDHWDLARLYKTFYRDSHRGIPLYKGVTYMPRGSTLQLPDGRTVMFAGGAESIDKARRTLGIDWFPEEVISQAEAMRMVDYKGRVDIVISHTTPREWVPDECRIEKVKDPSRVALSRLLEAHKPDLWYSGHWHHEARGVYGNTRWVSLDHASHGGLWWEWLKE